MKEKIISQNLDANESMFFARELETVKAKTYDKKYPALKATTLIPVSLDAGTGAEMITYQQYDQVGIMKIITNYADDLPRSDVYGKEFHSKVVSLGGSYGYNVQEIRTAQKAGKSLNEKRATSVRKANDIKADRLAWFGDETAGVTGLLNNVNIPAAAAHDPGGGTAWSTKTPAQILKDLNDSVTAIEETTKSVEVPDTIVLPIAQWRIISTTNMGTGTDTTIKKYFMDNNPDIKTIERINEFKDVSPLPSGAAGPGDIMLTYAKDVDVLSLEIPQPFEQFPAQERNLEFVVPAHSRFGGVIVYYPLALNITESI